MKELEALFGKDNPEEVARNTAAFLGQFLEQQGLSDNPVIKRIMDGMTPAQAMGLSRDELNVLYAVGFQKLNSQDWDAAHDMFAYLSMIDPLHAPNLYCLGVAQQGRGNHDLAEQAFIGFLARDATNPVGYLRFGECKLVQGDKKMAKEAFELAEKECLNGHGDAVTLEEARAKLALLHKE